MILKDITKPNCEQKWSLKEGNETIVDETVIADVFNTYFVQKIQDIKSRLCHFVGGLSEKKQEHTTKSISIVICLKLKYFLSF